MKSNLLVALLFLSCSFNTYAVTHQIEQAQYLISTLEIKEGEEAIAISPAKSIQPKQKNNAIPLLKSQLGWPEGSDNRYDDELMEYVKTFQDESVNLNPTGILDLNTWFSIYEQNNSWKKSVLENAISEWSRILAKQITEGSEKFIVVNIPSMTLQTYYWNGEVANEDISSRIVVGKSTSRTPMNDFKIWGIKYNPTWTPTPNMLKKSLYKEDGVDVKWLKSHHIVVSDENNQVIPIDQIVKGKKYRYHQPAGDNNALGLLKFETTSSQNIYLHDTNERYLFSNNTRLNSSGCIRVENFIELAKFLTDLEEETINNKIANKSTFTEKMTRIPVYFSYSQVWFEDGKPIYSPDVYSVFDNTEYK